MKTVRPKELIDGTKDSEPKPRSRRVFTPEFKQKSVQMLLDGHTAVSICERLGLSGPNLLYRWKRELVSRGGSTAVGLEARVRTVESELRRVERERDILKKVLCIFGRDG